MYLKAQLNTIVQTCRDNDIKAQDVLTIVRTFYAGRIPSETTVHELIENIYAVPYDDIIRDDTEQRAKTIIEAFKRAPNTTELK